MQSITAIYVPLDGMNAKGLVVADLTAGDDEETYQRTGKVNLTTTTAIRLCWIKPPTLTKPLCC